MAIYEPTIGLEIHAELKTHTKMFCRSKNDSDELEPNVNICPVCMAHPGSLPVVNKEAVRQVLRVGVALGAKLADYTEFDRKNYFYPDLPKGYQLSQYAYPLVTGGELAGVQITRIHLEEDTASSIHDEASGATEIDYNRAGVPRMELVTEPVIKSAEQAGSFGRELQLLLRYLGAAEANMEKGEMRVEANVSVSTDATLGTKVEIKNLNSFKAMERAVEYEIKRQISVLSAGGIVEQQTLGWDENKQATFPQRSKEGSADYRYFPDPDLPSMKLSEIKEFSVERIRSEMPELPAERRARYIGLGVKREDADAFVRDVRLSMFFDECIQGMPKEMVKIASNYLANDLVKIIRDVEPRDTEQGDKIPMSVSNFVELVQMIAAKEISSRAAKDILAIAVSEGASPRKIATLRDLLQKSDAGALESCVKAVLDRNPSVVIDFKAGKGAALEFLLGQCMKELRGAGDPAVLREMLQNHLR